MAWSDPSGDLRITLADTATDNLVKAKKVLGPINGVNTTFYTFDDRLVASGNQAVCGTPLRVFVSNVNSPQQIISEIAASGITVTDRVRGEFQLSYAPSGQLALIASYHFQQHLDSEISFYLQQATYRVGVDIVANVDQGLQAAVLDYAEALAHTRLAQRWQQRKSEQFLLQDEPARKEAESLIQYHQEEAKTKTADGQQARRDFYDLRQDRGRAPSFTVLNRVPRPYTPRQ